MRNSDHGYETPDMWALWRTALQACILLALLSWAVPVFGATTSTDDGATDLTGLGVAP